MAQSLVQKLTTTFVDYKGVQSGFEALRLMRLRFSGGQMLQNYQLLRDILNPKIDRVTTTFPVQTVAGISEPLRVRSTTTTR